MGDNYPSLATCLRITGEGANGAASLSIFARIALRLCVLPLGYPYERVDNRVVSHPHAALCFPV